MATARLELQGNVYDQLEVIRLERVDKKNGTMWRCRCSCQKEVVLRGSHLTAGDATKCRQCATKAMQTAKSYGQMGHWYWRQVLRGAEARAISVDLTPEEAWQLFLDQEGKCAFTGIKLDFPPRSNRAALGTASLDRKDSRIGYSITNCQWVHKVINRMKMEFDDDQFVWWCAKVASNQLATDIEVGYEHRFVLRKPGHCQAA